MVVSCFMFYDWVVVGSGLFGSVFAHELVRKGKKVLVLDRREHIGGNVYTESVEGINVHKYGSHVIHTSDKRVWDYVNQFADFNGFVDSPLAFYKNKLYNLPFNMNTFYQLWGVRFPKEAKKIIRLQSEYPRIFEPKNLEEKCISLVGFEVYEKFVKGYTEKQWGKSCSELPCFIIDRLPVRFTFDNNYFDDEFQGVPIGGYTPIIRKLLDGADVLLGTDFLEDKEYYLSHCDNVLFTGMIDEYFDYCFGDLEYRSLRFEECTLDTSNYQGNAVVNFTDKLPYYTRIIEHKHFEGTVSSKTVISYEYPKSFKRGEEAYYPVNDGENNRLYSRYFELSESCADNVVFGGRLGEYKYMNMDEVIGEALDLVSQFI